MARETLPSGGWVEMRDPAFLRGKDRDALIRRVQGPETDGLSDTDKGLKAIKELAALMVEAWELPYQPDNNDDGTARSWTLPKNDTTILEELLAPDLQFIENHLEAAQKVLMPLKASPDQHADPESPSGPESA